MSPGTLRPRENITTMAEIAAGFATAVPVAKRRQPQAPHVSAGMFYTERRVPFEGRHQQQQKGGPKAASILRLLT